MQVCKDLCKQVYMYAAKKECKLTSVYFSVWGLPALGDSPSTGEMTFFNPGDFPSAGEMSFFFPHFDNEDRML